MVAQGDERLVVALKYVQSMHEFLQKNYAGDARIPA